MVDCRRRFAGTARAGVRLGESHFPARVGGEQQQQRAVCQPVRPGRAGAFAARNIGRADGAANLRHVRSVGAPRGRKQLSR